MSRTYTEKIPISRRIWAFLTAIFTSLSFMIPSFDMLATTVGAERVEQYTVNFQYFDHDKTTPITIDDVEGAKESFLNNKHYVVAVAKGGNKNPDGEDWMIYAVKKVTDANSVTINNSDFIYDNKSAYGTTHNLGDYNTDNYSIRDVSLYEFDESVQIWEFDSMIGAGWGTKWDYDTIMSKLNRISGAPDGFTFLYREFNNNDATIQMYDSKYDVSLYTQVKFDSPGEPITASDNYYVVTEVVHAGVYSTYNVQPLITDGSGSDFSYKIEKGDWLDNNGNPLPNESFSGNEISWSTYIVKTAKDNVSTSNIIKLSDTAVKVAEGESVQGYVVESSETSDEKDDANYTHTYYSTVNLNKNQLSADYNYISVLGEAVNYGIVTNTMSSAGHSQTNFAAKVYTGDGNNVDPNLSGDGNGNHVPGTYLIGEIKGSNLKIGKDSPDVATYVIVGEDSKNKVEEDKPVDKKVVVTVPEKTETINNEIDSMISHMKTVSADMASKTANFTPNVGESTIYIDTTSVEPDDATIYIDADKYASYISTLHGVKIKKKPEQVIVFNFTSTEEVKISAVDVDYGEGYYDTITEWTDFKETFPSDQNNHADMVSRQIVWNLNSATNVTLSNAGGMFLLPNDTANVNAGGTSCGWIINAGHSELGAGGEFHFVYQGMNSNIQPKLYATKQVNGNAPAADEVFEFGIEKLNSEGVFETVMTTDENGKSIPMTVTNNGASITIPVTQIADGDNIFRIFEIGQSETTAGSYNKNKQEFFANITAKVYVVNGAEVTLPSSGTVYYSTFKNGVLSGHLNQSQVIFTNTISNGSFSVKKTVTGEGADPNETFTVKLTATDADGNGLSDIYDVTGIKGNSRIRFVNGKVTTPSSGTIKLKDGQTVTITGLPEGAIMTVEEINIPDGYKLETAAENLTATVSSEKAAEVVVENSFNTVEAPKGSLIITKSFDKDGLTPEEFDSQLTFSVKNSAGEYYDPATKSFTASTNVKSFTMKEAGFVKDETTGEWTLTISDVPVGTYTVKEENVAVTGYNFEYATVNGGSITDTSAIQANASVAKDATATVAIVDKYTKTEEPKGNLVITKTIDGENLTISEFEGALKFTIKDESNNYYNGTAFVESKTPVELTLRGNFSKEKDSEGKETGRYILEINNIPVGSKYTVTETNADVEGYELTGVLFGKEDKTNAAERSAEITVTSGTQTLEIEDSYRLLQNEYEKDFVIRKVWDDLDNRFGTRQPITIVISRTAKDADGNTVKEGYSPEEVVLNETNGWELTKTLLTRKTVGKTTTIYDYSFTEKEVPAGYTGEGVVIADVADNTVSVTATNKLITAEVKISKTDKIGDGLAGAMLTITGKDKDGKNIKFDLNDVGLGKGATNLSVTDDGKTIRFESGTEATIIKNLIDGTYTLHEVAAPRDYDKASDITFVVDNGKVMDSDGNELSDNTVIMVDNKNTVVTINKFDITGENEIEGAALTLTGNDVEETWTSKKGETWTVTLKDGTYTLKETGGEIKVDGKIYKVVTSELTFTVDNGKIISGENVEDISGGKIEVNKDKNTIKVCDAEREPNDTEVTINKFDITGENEIEGAVLTLTGNGKEETWTSKKGETWTVTLKDGTYTLKETGSEIKVDGKIYKVVTSELTFTVADGKITSGDNVGNNTDGKIEVNKTDNSIKVCDAERNPEDTAVTISKKAIGGGDELPGASLKITTDVEGKTIAKDSKSNAALEWTSTNEAKTVILADGEYYLRETGDEFVSKLDNKTYKIVSSVLKFTVEDGTITEVVNTTTENDENGFFTVDKEKKVITISDAERTEPVPDTVTIKVSKVDASSNEEIGGAEIKVVKDDNTFTESWTSEEGKTKELSVTPGDYTMTEVSAPEGYEAVTTQIKFTVKDDGTVELKTVDSDVIEIVDGKLVLKNKKKAGPAPLTIHFSKKDVSGNGKDIAGAEFKLVRKSDGKTWTWISKNGYENIELGEGEYTLTELTAPYGYAIRQKVTTFEINENDGELVLENVQSESVKYGDDEIRIENKPIVFEFVVNPQDGTTKLPDGIIATIVKKESTEEDKAGTTYKSKADDFTNEEDKDKAGKRVDTIDGDSTEGTGLENVQVIYKNNNGSYREDDYDQHTSKNDEGQYDGKYNGEWEDVSAENDPKVIKTPNSVTYDPTTMDIKNIPAGNYQIIVRIPVIGYPTPYVVKIIEFSIGVDGEIRNVVTKANFFTDDSGENKGDITDQRRTNENVVDKPVTEVFNKIEVFTPIPTINPGRTDPDTPHYVPVHVPSVPGTPSPSTTTPVPTTVTPVPSKPKPEDVSAGAAEITEGTETETGRNSILAVLAICALLTSASVVISRKIRNKSK